MALGVAGLRSRPSTPLSPPLSSLASTTPRRQGGVLAHHVLTPGGTRAACISEAATLMFLGIFPVDNFAATAWETAVVVVVVVGSSIGSFVFRVVGSFVGGVVGFALGSSLSWW